MFMPLTTTAETYRGGAPVHYAIMEGEAETGVTIAEMIKKWTLVEFSASEKCYHKTKMMWDMFEKRSQVR